MDVGRVSGALLQISAATPAATLPDLPLGRPIAVRVLAALDDGSWLVDVAGQRVVARAVLPLAAGDALEVVASRHEGQLDLRVVEGAARFDDRQYALATLAQAGARAGPSPALPSAERLLALVSAALSSPEAPAGNLSQALAQLLSPLDPAQPPEALAGAVRRFLTDGGVLLESRLREWLDRGGSQGGPRAFDGAREPLPPSAQRDLRVLLAEVARGLAADVSTTAGTGADPGAAAEHHSLAQAVLARQLDVAYQWLLEGRMLLDLPFQFQGSVVPARLRITTETPAQTRSGAPRVFTFELRVDLPDTGRMLAWVHWAGAALSARVVVENDDVRRLVETEVRGLADGLRRAGVASTRTEVVVDPAALRRPDPPPEPPPAAGGTIISARA